MIIALSTMNKDVRRLLVLGVAAAVAGTLFLVAYSTVSNLRGTETRTVTICSKKPLSDSGTTEVRTSFETYVANSNDADLLKRGGTYEVTTTSGISLGNFTQKRKITSAVEAPAALGGECS